MTEALKAGTFVEGNPDSAIFDYDSQAISCQKRIKSIVNAGPDLHPKYCGYVWLRVEYGVDPSWRAYSDGTQERAAEDAIRFLPGQADNKRLIQTLKHCYQIYSGRSTSTLITNPDDYKRLYGSAQESFAWAATLPVRNRAPLNVAPVMLALVELHLQDPEKAIQVADHLFFAGKNTQKLVQPVQALLQWHQASVTRRLAPLGARGGSQGVSVHHAVVPYFRAVLLGNTVNPEKPSEKAIALGWANPRLAETFQKALQNRVPKIRTLHAGAVIKQAAGSPYVQATKTAQQHGLISSNSVFAALTLLNGDKHPNQAQAIVEENIAAWNEISRHTRRIYAAQPEDQRFLPPAALTAFLWKHRASLKEALKFIADYGRKMAAILAVIQPRGKNSKVTAAQVLPYLCHAFQAVSNGEALPSVRA